MFKNRFKRIRKETNRMKFILKMVFCLVPLAIFMVASAIVVTAYMLINSKKLSRSVADDNEIFLEA